MPGSASLRGAQRGEQTIFIINKVMTPGRVTAIIVNERYYGAGPVAVEGRDVQAELGGGRMGRRSWSP